MFALVYGIVRAGSAGWSDRLTLASLGGGLILLAAFVLTERRAQQPITPLRLFASRERVGAYVARVLFVGAMFGQFFFLTQYLQVVQGFSPIAAGVAFLPLTLVLFAVTNVVPGLVARFGNSRILSSGILVAFAGMAWLSRVGPDTDYLTGVAVPMAVLAAGAAAAFTPLTTAGVAGVASEDAGAASGLVNAAHQLGGSLGLGVLVTVFASALPRTPAGAGASQHAAALAHAISTSLAAGAGMLGVALAIVLALVRPQRPADVTAKELPLPELEEQLAA
jgi:predicted MFS family arabinose efflux permease